MTDRSEPLKHAAYGGPGWRPRQSSLAEESGGAWGEFGLDSEYQPLRSVLLHRPGSEIVTSDPNEAQMLDTLDLSEAQAQHDGIADAYRRAGVEVNYVEAPDSVQPNQMFMADLLAMTPQGAILARPASMVRAGEERLAAANLARIGAPILRSISGRGTFEGADLAWLSPNRVLVGQGLRTNREAIDQISNLLGEQGVTVTRIDMPVGSMHFMGMLRIVDKDLAIAWPTRLAWAAADALAEEGYEVRYLPDMAEAVYGFALNSVTVGPRHILMGSGNPVTQSFYEGLGIECTTVKISGLSKASGAIGCLTGIVSREPA